MGFIVKNTTLFSPLDLIAPHTCRGCGVLGEVLCDCCKNNIVLANGNFRPEIELPFTFFAVGSRNSILGELINDYKYNSTRALGVKLAEILDETLPNFDGEINIVPLPTISRHVRERGFDHTLFIAKRLAKIRGKEYTVSSIMERDKNSVQVGTDRITRLVQAESAYALSPKTKINPEATYLLFDDVFTTGASMKAAAKKLQQAGANKIVMAVLALSQ